MLRLKRFRWLRLQPCPVPRELGGSRGPFGSSGTGFSFNFHIHNGPCRGREKNNIVRVFGTYAEACGEFEKAWKGFNLTLAIAPDGRFCLIHLSLSDTQQSWTGYVALRGHANEVAHRFLSIAETVASSRRNGTAVCHGIAVCCDPKRIKDMTTEERRIARRPF